MISDKLYNILVKVQRFLPAIGLAYLEVSRIWGLALGNEVNATIAVIATLLGTFIEIAISVYNKNNRQEKKEE